MTKVLNQQLGEGWFIYNADSCDVLESIPENSLHYAIWSPPFMSLYTFSDSARDVSNNQDDKTFWDHYRFIMQGVFRAMRPGRLISIHCMALPTSITRNGFIGMTDFPGDNIRLAQDCGFIYHSEVVIRKDPVSAMQRTKAIGLLHKQIVKDSAISRMAIADKIVTMRKPGINETPIAGVLDHYYGDDLTNEQQATEARSSYQRGGQRTPEEHRSIDIWQRYAEPIWDDIVQGDVLSRSQAREEADERHISPLQLTPIRRCAQLWSNPGEVIFSPFAGIGSAGYVAIEMGRRFIGVELKPSYFAQAVANLKTVERERNSRRLL